METVKVFIKGLITNIIFSAILFLFAGKTNYLQGWVFLSANVLATILNSLWIAQDIGLANERSKPGEGIKSWDKLILGLSALSYMLVVITAGLDSGRFNPTHNFNWLASIAGVVIFLLGQLLFVIARKQNTFFSTVVRIQKDRGHTVCDKGLYRIIRHPGYLGTFLSLSAVPLITTSIWSIIPTAAALILLIIRTVLEDRTLMDELPGYVEYSKTTRYRLIPYLW